MNTIKFQLYILKYNFPWFVKYTLGELYPRILRGYRVRNRNITHLDQLIIEMLKICGYEEYALGIKRTVYVQHRRAIRDLVRDIIKEFGVSNQPLPRIEQLSLLSSNIGEIDTTKVLENSIYWDKLV